MDPIAHLLVIVACLLLSAFFSGSETALLRLRQEEIDHGAREGSGPAGVAVRSLLDSTSRLLVTILLGNNVVNILAASVASAMAVYYLGEQLGIAVATITLTLIVLIFCEVIPKAWAAHNPRPFAHRVALPLYLLHQGLRPLHLLFDRLVEPLVRSIAGETTDADGPASSEEILRMVERAREGQPQGSALAIIGSAADAADTNVGEIMVPRTEMTAFPVDTPPAELLDRLLEGRYTRLPIYEGSIDHVLGIVHLKDLIVHVHEKAADVRPILKPLLRVPPRKRILPLLRDMQRSFCHMAVVKDEFGVTEGLVTQEDILEELVGEIRDEFDRDELLEIQALDPETFQAVGRVKVQDFNRETGWEVPAEPGDTLGGLVFNALGRSPQRADAVALEGYRLVVAGLSGARITQVRVERVPPPAQRKQQGA